MSLGKGGGRKLAGAARGELGVHRREVLKRPGFDEPLSRLALRRLPGAGAGAGDEGDGGGDRERHRACDQAAPSLGRGRRAGHGIGKGNWLYLHP
jgi:hypothetical protein